MAHGDARKRKWMGNWRMQWVASTPHTTSEHGVSSITTADAHTSAVSSRLNWRPPADLNGLANAVGSQYSSHYLGTWCIQHYYRWCAHLGCQQSTELMPPGWFKWTRLFHAKDEIWFLWVCHHISTGLYTVWIQQLVLIVLSRWLSVVLTGRVGVPFVVSVRCTSWWWDVDMP